ncbi:MAG: NAD(P)H-hydrate dehydratase [Coriobacteriia bacterium]|nr:NAD(P)H-hydrate dehydratase [Coriobacteriia bacterium]
MSLTNSMSFQNKRVLKYQANKGVEGEIMSEILTLANIEALEENLVKQGVSEEELMKTSGTHVALVATEEFGGGPYLVLCGNGNNGGDGWVTADELGQRGYEVVIVSALTPEEITSEPARKMAIHAVEVGLPIYVNPDLETFERLIQQSEVIIDAVFGTGFTGERIDGVFGTWIKFINEQYFGKILSIDVPSGLHASRGVLSTPHIKADITVTMFALKPGFLTSVAREALGELVIADIAPQVSREIIQRSFARQISAEKLLQYIPPFNFDDDKYSRGSVLIIGGSQLYAGAAILSAKAAERTGAGYTTLVVPSAAAHQARAHLSSIPVMAFPSSSDGGFDKGCAEYIKKLAQGVDVVVCGPGMGKGEGAQEIVRALLEEDCPLVLDADALNILALLQEDTILKSPYILRRHAPLILTPHAKELGRLTGEPGHKDLLTRLKGAKDLAWSVGSDDFCVLTKGDRTAAVSIDASLLPDYSNPSLSKAGTGDVLAGCLGALLAQHHAHNTDVTVEKIAALASYLHARAADRAVSLYGSRGINALDVCDALGIIQDVLLEVDER